MNPEIIKFKPILDGVAEGFYIQMHDSSPGLGWMYLWRDGQWHSGPWYTKSNKFEQGYWNTREEAQRVLDKWESTRP